MADAFWLIPLGQVDPGKSVRKIQRMQFKTARVSWGGYPDLPGRAFGFGINSSIFRHCSFVRSIELKSINKNT